MLRCIRTFFTLVVPIAVAYDTNFISVTAAVREELARTLTTGSTNETQTTLGNPFPAIVGGTPVEENEFPWFGRTAISLSNSFESIEASCGASLIHSDMAVSAAHCIGDAGYSYSVTFYLGANKYDGSDGIALEVENMYYPKDFNFPSNDIVLYKLRTATDVTPVSWNTNPLIPLRGDIGTAIGFGLTSDDGDESSILLKVDLPAITNLECSTFYFDTADSITCTYAQGQGKDICQGDSGGPIITNDGVLYGVASFTGEVCGDIPAGFTRTSYMNDFITKVSSFLCLKIYGGMSRHGG
jgi:secreted trypsin-like serine protease